MTTFQQKILAQLDKMKCLPPLLARITLAVVFLVAGAGKLQKLDRVAEYFVSLHISYPLLSANLVAWTELLIGLCMLFGVYARTAAVPLIWIMIMAMIKTKGDQFGKFSDLFNFTEFLYLVLAFWILVAGPGEITIQRWVNRLKG